MSGRRRKPKGTPPQKQGGGQASGRRQSQGRPAASETPARPSPTELFAVVPAPPSVERITPAEDPTAVLRSLGPPPLAGQSATALAYLAAVAERAAGLATALAAANDLLELPEVDDPTDDPTDD